MKKYVIAFMVIVAAILTTGMYQQEPEKVQVSYLVHNGDTLWEIAGELKEKYGDKRDIREIIHYIARDNGGSRIFSGQSLNITLEVSKQDDV